MISLTKRAKPKILTDNATKWTRELLDVLQAGEDPTDTQRSRYRHPEIKEALKQETNQKCAYCESKPLHVTYGDVEHVVPKAVRPELSFEWSNLTLACDICNTNKSNQEGFVDPYVDNPVEEFSIRGPMIFAKPGKHAAERTITRLELNRIPLIERRRDKLNELSKQVSRIHETADPRHRDFLIDTLIQYETSDDKEYAACVRAFVHAEVADGHLGLDRDKNDQPGGQ